MAALPNLPELIHYAHYCMQNYSELVHPGTWQSVDVSDKPEMATHEVLSFHASAPVKWDSVEMLAYACEPHLPWADDHFAERVSGEPINPGSTWKNWPYAHKADTFRDAKGQFNHNYMERYWPPYAGAYHCETLTPQQYREGIVGGEGPAPHFGIRHRYGDLNDLVDLFVRDPLTRQAYVPIFFPEDTGAHHLGRVPCTLGYHFIIRNNQLHVTYFMRSCDLLRHFNDDIYLTVRLQLWLLEQLRSQAPGVFDAVTPGTFTLHISSLHIFRNDWRQLYGDMPTPGSLAGKPAVVSGYTGGGSSSRASGGHGAPGHSYGGQQIERGSVSPIGGKVTSGQCRYPEGGYQPPLLAGDTPTPFAVRRPGIKPEGGDGGTS